MPKLPRHLPRLLLLCIAISIAVALWSVITLRKVMESNTGKEQSHLKRQIELSQLRLSAEQLLAESRAYLLTGSNYFRERAKESAIEVQQHVEALHADDAVRPLITSEVRAFSTKWDAFAREMDSLFRLKEREPGSVRIREDFLKRLTPLSSEWRSHLNTFSRTLRIAYRNDFLNGQNETHEVLARIWAVILMMLFLFIAAHWLNVAQLRSDLAYRRQIEEQLAASNERFFLSEEAANIAIWEWHPETDTILLSPRGRAMLGYGDSDPGDNTLQWRALVHPDDLSKSLAVREEVSSGSCKSFHVEQRMRHKNGTYRWVLSRGRLVREPGGRVRWIGANIDISDRKDAEMRLENASRLVQQNEKRLLELTEELRKSNTELERFAYIASHDLKEPLRMISTYLGLLSRQAGPSLTPEHGTYLGYALEGSKRLNGLVDSLLRFSRIGQGQVEFEPVALDDVVSEVMEGLRGAIQEKGAVIRTQALPTVTADRMLIGQLFQNLLSNALKFIRSGTQPVINISARNESGEVVVMVQDNGVGIKASDQHKIFEIFRRLHPRTDFPGEGIGLASCKKIVETHGGRIWVTSQHGQGSAFCFSLPLQPPKKLSNSQTSLQAAV